MKKIIFKTDPPKTQPVKIPNTPPVRIPNTPQPQREEKNRELPASKPMIDAPKPPAPKK